MFQPRMHEFYLINVDGNFYGSLQFNFNMEWGRGRELVFVKVERKVQLQQTPKLQQIQAHDHNRKLQQIQAHDHDLILLSIDSFCQGIYCC